MQNPIRSIASKYLNKQLDLRVRLSRMVEGALAVSSVQALTRGSTETDVREILTGSGFGLAICRELARSYGGDVVIESEYSEGTTVVIFLPAGMEGRAGE